MTKREIELGKLLYPESDHQRPSRREECIGGERPCPFVSCKHHLYVDVSPRTGAIKLNFPDLEVWEMNESCAIDVADRGGTTLEDVGAIMNLTRERIRQVEVRALAKLEALDDMLALRDYVDEGPVGKRRLPVIQPKVVGVKVAGVKVAGVKVAGVMGKSAAAVVASSASDDDDDDDDMDAGVHCDG
ncbi:MAG: hypothetical protein EXR75_09930 [Myxococcales bacterium]|nr:hypothetical protein [Myxococcales bacterium]